MKQCFIKRYTYTIIRTFVFITSKTVLFLKRDNRHFNNDARSGHFDLQCYDVLELIKDGRATASRYSSKILRFRRRDAVAIFSNADPDMSQLSKDRWKIFYININGLNIQEKRPSKEKLPRKSNC